MVLLAMERVEVGENNEFNEALELFDQVALRDRRNDVALERGEHVDRKGSDDHVEPQFQSMHICQSRDVN